MPHAHPDGRQKEDIIFMEQESRRDIALMRYSVIAPVIHGLPDDYGSLTAYFEEASARELQRPDGTTRSYAPKTMQKWYSDYQKGGFDALLPAGRSDAGRPRKLDADLMGRISHLKENYPRMGASAIFRQLREDGSIKSGEVSESTVNRYVNRLDAQKQEPGGKDMRRYERPHINEVWCGDSSVGPYLTVDGKKRRVYIIALVDDASRFVTGAGVFFEDTFVNLMSVMKSAVAKYGCPQVFRFDNGSAYKNKQMELLAARIGTTLSYCRPYTPVAKAKIERWFRTLKDQWMATLDMRDFPTLEALSGSLAVYVRAYNLTPHSSLKGKSPQERFFSEPEKIRRLPDEKLERDFLLEIERRVSADCVITISNVEYEVDTRFAKQRIRLRCSPGMKEVYIAQDDGTLAPLRLLNKQENAVTKREKLLLSEGGTSPKKEGRAE